MAVELINCPGCNVTLEVGGPGRYRCPACGQEFRHPHQEPKQEAPMPGLSQQPGQGYIGPPASAPDVTYDPAAVWGGQPPAQRPAPQRARMAPRQAPQAAPMPEMPRVPPPFERPSEFWFLSGLFRTLGATIADPVRFFRRLQTTGPLITPFFYYMLLAGTAKIINSMLQWTLMLAVGERGMADFMAVLGERFQGEWLDQVVESMSRENVIATLARTPIEVPLVLMIVALASAGLMHAFVLAFNSNNQGFRATLRVFCYAAGPGVFMAIPWLGSIIAIPWCAILQVIGLAHVHRISYGQAAAATVIPLLMMSCAVCLV